LYLTTRLRLQRLNTILMQYASITPRNSGSCLTGFFIINVASRYVTAHESDDVRLLLTFLGDYLTGGAIKRHLSLL
jgi:hypothetical protein